jgi:ankyrin repeat protein
MAGKSKTVRFALCALPIALAFAFFGWRSYKFVESKRLGPALINAVKSNDLIMVKSLLERGADANARDIPSRPSDFLALLKSILKPDPAKRIQAFPSALVLAAEHEKPLQMVAALLDHGADPTVTRPQGGNVLTHMLEPYPAIEPDPAAFRLLLEHEADPNASLESKPLILMAYEYAKRSDLGEEGKPQFFNMLLEHKANPNAVDEEGRTLLKLAMDDEKTDAFRRLLNAGADPNKKNEGRSPLLDAVQNRNPEAVRMLLDKRADPNQVDSERTSPLMVASFNGDADIARELLAAGARIDLEDSDGHSAASFASGSPQVIALLSTTNRR